jgi:tetratricopeptide (TPR) repeat protein
MIVNKYLLPLILICLFSCKTKTADELLLDAEKLEEAGKYEEAIPLLDEAIKLDPNLFHAYLNRGADKSALKNYHGAIKDYEEVLKLDSDNILALYNLALNYSRLDNPEQVVFYCNQALDAKFGKSNISLQVHDENGNMTGFDVPAYQIYYERGLAYYEIDSINLSIPDLDYAISNNYKVADCHFIKGANYEVYNMKVEACVEYHVASKMGYKDADIAISEFCTDK